MTRQPIDQVERDDLYAPTHPYRRLLRALTKAEVRLERALNRTLSYEQNPLYFHGALPTFVFWMLVASGLGLLVYYKATLGEAYGSIEYMKEVPFGSVIRSSHRWTADAMLIAVYLHIYRVYVTDRHREYRIVPWLTGVGLLLLTYIAGISGYLMVTDERAWGLVYHIRGALQAVPVIGAGLDQFFLGGPAISDYTLSRFLFFHVGAASAIFFFLWWHLTRISRPFLVVTIGLGAYLVGFILLFSGLWPAGSYTAVVNPRLAPDAFSIGDWLYLPGFWLLSWAGPVLFWAAVVGFFALLMVLPYVLRDPRRNIAHVVRDKCVGCRLCAIDCPYQAIKMLPVWNERKKKPDLLAVVYPPRCSECGVCIGSCDFDAIELGAMPYVAIEDLVKELAPAREPQSEAAGD